MQDQDDECKLTSQGQAGRKGLQVTARRTLRFVVFANHFFSFLTYNYGISEYEFMKGLRSWDLDATSAFVLNGS